jgi:hypothetical protein
LQLPATRIQKLVWPPKLVPTGLIETAKIGKTAQKSVQIRISNSVSMSTGKNGNTGLLIGMTGKPVLLAGFGHKKLP